MDTRRSLDLEIRHPEAQPVHVVHDVGELVLALVGVDDSRLEIGDNDAVDELLAETREQAQVGALRIGLEPVHPPKAELREHVDQAHASQAANVRSAAATRSTSSSRSSG